MHESSVPLEDILQAGWGEAQHAELAVLKRDRVWSLRLPDGRRCILKDWGPKDAGLEARVAFYQDVMSHVVQQGVPAEIKVRSRNGGYIHRHDGHAFSLGLALDESSEQLDAIGADLLEQSYGEAIGAIHTALATYPIADARARTWWKDVPGEAAAALDGLQTFQPALFQRLDDLIPNIDQQVLAPLRSVPEQLIIFDCHHGNLLRCGHRVSGFIDYDHLSIGKRVWDLGNFLGQDLARRLAESSELWQRQADLLLRGYVQAHPLPAAERQAIWCSMVAGRILGLLDEKAAGRHAEFLLTEIAALRRVRTVFG